MCVQNLKFVALPVPAIIGGNEKFRQSLDTLTLPFPQIFNGLLFAWTFWIYLPNLNFIALPIPETIGGTQKIYWYAHAPFYPKFFMLLCSDGPCECISQICSPYSLLVVLEIIAMAVFGVGLRTPYLLGEEEAVEGHWNVFVCDFL